MELTLWNERAVGNDFSVGAVVFLKKAGVVVGSVTSERLVRLTSINRYKIYIYIYIIVVSCS